MEEGDNKVLLVGHFSATHHSSSYTSKFNFPRSLSARQQRVLKVYLFFLLPLPSSAHSIIPGKKEKHISSRQSPEPSLSLRYKYFKIKYRGEKEKPLRYNMARGKSFSHFLISVVLSRVGGEILAAFFFA